MKLATAFFGVGIATIAMCASQLPGIRPADSAMVSPRVLERRDAFTCYGVRPTF
jgi:hypothetical protein